MLFDTKAAPHFLGGNSINRVMRDVLIALVPGTVAMTWFFGWGILINIVIASLTAVACEALVMRVRGEPAAERIQDLSAVVAAVLLALALPPLAPWWLTVIASSFAIVIVKHLFGGLGHNPFNPAMAGYVCVLISFPREMTQWLPPDMLMDNPPGLLDAFNIMVLGSMPAHLSVDSLTLATPLDTVKTRLNLMDTMHEIRASALFGDFAGRGWEWVGNWYFIGGIWLIWRKVITWHVPVALLGSLMFCALVFFLIDPDANPSPLFHVFSGGAMLAAFFIATDPVSGCTSVKGRLLFGAGVGVFAYVIRAWGSYPDGIAFAILLMNMAAPAIDYFTRPRVFGEQSDS